MAKKITISEGMSFAYLIPGIILIVVGIVMAQFFLVLAVLIPVGLLLILASTGVDVDVEGRKYRKYVGFTAFKTGGWKSLESYSKLELKESTQQYTKRTFIQTIVAGSGETIMHKTYDICLIEVDGAPVEVNDFDNYDDAVKCLNALQKATGIKPLNHYAIETARLWKKRKGRR